MATQDIKSFFHEWASKVKCEVTFNTRATGPKHRQRFLCEVRVTGHPYVGAGNSTSKKDAEKVFLVKIFDIILTFSGVFYNNRKCYVWFQSLILSQSLIY